MYGKIVLGTLFSQKMADCDRWPLLWALDHYTVEPAVYYDHLGTNHNCLDHQGVLINRSHCSTGSEGVEEVVLQFWVEYNNTINAQIVNLYAY